MIWRNSSSVSVPGLVEHRLARADLADVVQLAAQADAVQAGAVEAEALRRSHGVLAHPDRVPAGVGVLGLERPGQHLDALQEQLLDPHRLLVHLALEVLLIEPVLQHQRALLEHARDPGLQLADGDGLEQEVRRAHVEAIDGRRRLAHAGEHDDRGVRVALAQGPEQADPVQLGHAHVGDDERRLPDALEHAERLAAAAGLEAGESLCLEHPDERAPHAGLVIDDQAVSGAGHDGRRAG